MCRCEKTSDNSSDFLLSGVDGFLSMAMESPSIYVSRLESIFLSTNIPDSSRPPSGCVISSGYYPTTEACSDGDVGFAAYSFLVFFVDPFSRSNIVSIALQYYFILSKIMEDECTSEFDAKSCNRSCSRPRQFMTVSIICFNFLLALLHCLAMRSFSFRFCHF